MDFSSKNLTIPRGKVLFAEYAPGTRLPRGFRFFGNCPEFTLSREDNTLDHFQSTGGLRTRDASISLGGDFGGTLVTDDINPANMRHWFMGTNRTVTQSAQTSVAYEIDDVMKGEFYQIGRTEAAPLGVGNLTTVAVAPRPTGTALVEFQDYEVDLASGLLQILPGSQIADESDITVTYSSAASTYTEVASGDLSIEGELRFVSDNPYGPNRKLTIPRVRLQPNGDLSFLTDPESPTWMQMSFGLMVMKKGNLPLVVNAEGLPALGVATA